MTDSVIAPDATPDTIAGVVRDAPFVRLVARDDGDSLAAASLLAGAARGVDTPFQIRIHPDPAGTIDDATGDSGPGPSAGTDDEVHVLVGVEGIETTTTSANDRSAGDGSADDGSADDRSTATESYVLRSDGRPASTAAFAVGTELGGDPDPVLALAGVVAAGSVPGTDGSGTALDVATQRGLVERQPGLAVPSPETDDGLATGIAASTLFHAPYSGAPDDVRATIGADVLADADRRRVASTVAVDVVAPAAATQRASSAVERALRPYATTGPVGTVGGYADVLDVLARESPGTGIALALAGTGVNDDLRSAAIETWQTHGTAVHAAIAETTMARYDGVSVARVSAPAATLPTVARLLREYRSPEPVTLVLDPDAGRVAAAATDPTGIGTALRRVAAERDGTGWGGPTRGGARVPMDDDGSAVIAATREAL
ncbi:exonuclease RecJ [Halopenitus sp. POP-27]|uniref:exonuclease RecJ n=1 Tax=Halopenitus sp. POP-27 TaxID=2994425 RepID=UPI0024682BEE|nr:exonuclease RecJ [Halopenitus sp. POP-27]